MPGSASASSTGGTGVSGGNNGLLRAGGPLRKRPVPPKAQDASVGAPRFRCATTLVPGLVSLPLENSRAQVFVAADVLEDEDETAAEAAAVSSGTGGVWGRSDFSTRSPPDRSSDRSVPVHFHPVGGSAPPRVSGKSEMDHRGLLPAPPRGPVICTLSLGPHSLPLPSVEITDGLLCQLTVLRGLKRRNHRRQRLLL